MELVRRIAVWSSVVALIRCSLNTPEELRMGREAIKEWRSLRTEKHYPEERVFGGFAPYVSMYPFAVYFMAKEEGRSWDCSGTILAPQWILSAAHCMGLTTNWKGIVFAGDVDFTTDRVFTKFNIQIRPIKQAYQYVVNDSYHHDIVLFKPFRGLIIEAGFVETIPMTTQTSYGPDFKEICTIVGFGLRGQDLGSGIQRAASFLMEPGAKCIVFGVRDNGLCTHDVETKSACSGDSGGPVFCAGKIVLFGIIVRGRYKNCTINYCGAPVEWNIHMFVGFYRAWIIETMNRYPDKRLASSHQPPEASLATLLLAGFLLTELGLQ